MKQLSKKDRKKLQEMQQKQIDEMMGISPSSGGGFFAFFFKVVAFLVGCMIFVALFLFGMVVH